MMSEDKNSDSGWLSTRNKRKISPPTVRTKRRKSVLHRPLGFGVASAYICNSPPPPEVFTRTKQTSIVSFFRTPKDEVLPFHDDTCDDFTSNTCEHRDYGTATVQSHSVSSLPESEDKENSPDSLDQPDAVSLHSFVDPIPYNSSLGALDNLCTTHTKDKLSVCKERISPLKSNKLTEAKCSNSRGNFSLERNSPKKEVGERFECNTPNSERTQDLSRFENSLGSIFDFSANDLEDYDSCLEACAQPSSTLSRRPACNEVSSEKLTCSEIMFSTEEESQLKTQDCVKSQTGDPVSLEDSEEPFTFAFLSQDLRLRTRGITPTSLGYIRKGDNSEDTSEEENFTLSANSPNRLGERYRSYGEDEDSEFTLNSQELASDEISLTFDSDPVATLNGPLKCTKTGDDVDRLSTLQIENFLDSQT